MQIYSKILLYDWPSDYLEKRPVHVHFFPSHILGPRVSAVQDLWVSIRLIVFQNKTIIGHGETRILLYINESVTCIKVSSGLNMFSPVSSVLAMLSES